MACPEELSLKLEAERREKALMRADMDSLHGENADLRDALAERDAMIAERDATIAKLESRAAFYGRTGQGF